MEPKMTLRIGNCRISAGRDASARGFTLIELILVMALLVVVLAIGAPSLARFFRGRNLDSEAHRFLALARYGRNRAVAEGVPMLLWIDQEQRRYGLMAESTYEEDDTNAVSFELARDLDVEVELSLTNTLVTPWRRTVQLVGKLPTIRFTPAGFIGETSPEYILFRQGENDMIWIGRSRNRLNYDIETNILEQIRR